MHDAHATTDDITYDGPDGSPVSAYVVHPAAPGQAGGAGATATGPGILALHWLDGEAPDGDRTQFLEEAAAWAARGVTSLLPQGRFPWHVDPTGADADRAAVSTEVDRVRAGLDLLAAMPGVDPSRLAVVGHDFGGMLATLVVADDPRPRAFVVIAATPRWGDWFLPFWQIADDRIDYLRAMRPLDPIEHIGRVAPTRVQFQFGERDFYIAQMTGREFARAAPEGSELRFYDSGHDMRDPHIRVDRLAFLARVLDLA
jgi:hypothetical protein